MALTEYSEDASSSYEAWSRGIRANCEKYGLIYPSNDAADCDDLPFNDGFKYNRTKITDDDDSFIGAHESRYGMFNPDAFLADPALVAPLTFKQVMRRKSPLTDIFTSQTSPMAMIIAEHYHILCLADVHRQLKIAVRKRLQRVHKWTTVRDIFQSLANEGRIYLNRTICHTSIAHQITLVLPDYDDHEENYDHDLPRFTLEFDWEYLEWQAKHPNARNRTHTEFQEYYTMEQTTVNPHMVTVHLMISSTVIARIPCTHIPGNISIDLPMINTDGPAFMEITVDMDYRHITDIIINQ